MADVWGEETPKGKKVTTPPTLVEMFGGILNKITHLNLKTYLVGIG